MALGASNLPYEIIHVVLDNLDNIRDITPQEDRRYDDYRTDNEIESRYLSYPQQMSCTLMLVNKHWADAVRDHPLYSSYVAYVKRKSFRQLLNWLQHRLNLGKPIHSCSLYFSDAAEFGAFSHFYDIMLNNLTFKSLSLDAETETPQLLPDKLKANHLRLNTGTSFPRLWTRSKKIPLLDSLTSLDILSSDDYSPPVFAGSTENIKSMRLTCPFYFHCKEEYRGIDDDEAKTIPETYHYRLLAGYPHLQELSLRLLPGTDQYGEEEGLVSGLDEAEHEAEMEFARYPNRPWLYGHTSVVDSADRYIAEGLVHLPPLSHLKILRSNQVQVANLESTFSNLRELHYLFTPGMKLGKSIGLPNKLEVFSIEYIDKRQHIRVLPGFHTKQVLSAKQPPPTSYRGRLRRKTNYDTIRVPGPPEVGELWPFEDKCQTDVFVKDFALFDKEQHYKLDHLKVFALRNRPSSLFTKYFNSGFFDDTMANLEVLVLEDCQVWQEAVSRFAAKHPKLRVIEANKYPPTDIIEIE